MKKDQLQYRILLFIIITYTHIETPQAENDNWLQAIQITRSWTSRPTLHTHTHVHTHTHTTSVKWNNLWTSWRGGANNSSGNKLLMVHWGWGCSSVGWVCVLSGTINACSTMPQCGKGFFLLLHSPLSLHCLILVYVNPPLCNCMH